MLFFFAKYLHSSLYNHIELASNLQAGSDYCLFKAGIKPMWEDERNKKGGRWLISVPKKVGKTLDEMWLECVSILTFVQINPLTCIYEVAVFGWRGLR